MNILETYGLEPVKVYTYAPDKNIKAKCPQLIYGVELEIERIVNHMVAGDVQGITVTHDNSLRNFGFEFITKPMALESLYTTLNTFFNKNKFTDQNYSERCSIHVHTNVQDMTLEQLQTLLMLYQIYERLLYKWVGGDRENNIFCVPWHQTLLHHGSLTEGGVSTTRSWQKYTGLNLVPIFSQGTVEWRHMPGHCDLNKIIDWCQIIGCMYRYAYNVPVDQAKANLLALNTTSQYDVITDIVFEEYADMFKQLPLYRESLEEGVLEVKYSFMKKNTTKKKIYGDLRADNLHADAVGFFAQGARVNNVWEQLAAREDDLFPEVR